MDSRLHDLLDDWEDHREQGVVLSAEELCARYPDWLRETPTLLDELKRTMHQLEVFRREVLDPSTSRDFADQQGALPTIENYQVERLAGVGGMGRVYLAKDEQLGLAVAIKVLEPRCGLVTHGDRKRLARRFVQEARTLAALNHPNIVRVFAGKPNDELPYFAMEYLPRSLADLAEQDRLRKLGPRAIAQLVVKVAEAVHYAHCQNVLHRDLKPSNILFDNRGEPKVCDFGLAKLVAEVADVKPTAMDDTINMAGDRTADPLTYVGHQPGTPAYMAPEQHDTARGPVDARSDVWALGVVLYELLTGHKPFAGKNRETLRQQVLTPPISPRGLRQDMPADLEAICLKCLETAPGNRYESARTLSADLERYLDWQPTAARPLSATTRAARWMQRQPTLAALVVVAFAAVVGLFGLGAWKNHELANVNKTLEAKLKEIDQHEVVSRNVKYGHFIQHGSGLWNTGQFRLFLELANATDNRIHELCGFEWHYLQSLAANLRNRVHDKRITCIAVSHDGTRCAVGSDDRKISLWDVNASKHLGTLQLRTSIRSIAFLPGDKTLMSTSGGGGVKSTEFRFWNVESQAEQPVPVEKLTVEDPGDIAISSDKKLMAVAGIFQTSDSRVLGVAIWNLATGKLIQGIKLERLAGYPSVSFSPDNKHLAFCCGWPLGGTKFGEIQVVDIVTGATLKKFACSNLVTSIAFSRDGKALASTGQDGAVRLWDLSTGKNRVIVERLGFGKSPGFFAFSPNGKTLEIGGAFDFSMAANSVKSWDLNLEEFRISPFQAPEPVSAMAWTPDGKTLVLGGINGVVRFSSINENPLLKNLPGHQPKEAWGLHFSPNGQMLATSGDDGNTHLWNLKSGKCVHSFKQDEMLVTSVAFCPKSQFLATGYYDKQLKIWDVTTKLLHRSCEGHTGKVRWVTFSPDGTTLASACDDRTTRLWDVESGKLKGKLVGHEAGVKVAAFMPDGKRLATGSGDRTVRFWDVFNHVEIAKYNGEDSYFRDFPRIETGVNSVSFSPDGKTFATAQNEATVLLVETETLKTRATCHGHAGRVISVAFSPDGRTFASGGEDKSVRLWQANTGQELLTFPDLPAVVRGVAFSPDSKTLAATLHDGTVRLWSANGAK